MNTISVKAVEGLSIIRVVCEVGSLLTLLSLATYGLVFSADIPIALLFFGLSVIVGLICYIDYQAYKVAAFVLENWEDE